VLFFLCQISTIVYWYKNTVWNWGSHAQIFALMGEFFKTSSNHSCVPPFFVFFLTIFLLLLLSCVHSHNLIFFFFFEYRLCIIQCAGCLRDVSNYLGRWTQSWKRVFISAQTQQTHLRYRGMVWSKSVYASRYCGGSFFFFLISCCRWQMHTYSACIYFSFGDAHDIKMVNDSALFKIL